MKKLFTMGGPGFMGVLTILLIIVSAWFIYHFIILYKSKHTNPEKLLRKIGYGKTIGLFTMIVGIIGQMVGLTAMFSAIEDAIKSGEKIIPSLVFGGIKVTMICTIYGIMIYLISLVLWLIASLLIERKFKLE